MSRRCVTVQLSDGTPVRIQASSKAAAAALAAADLAALEQFAAQLNRELATEPTPVPEATP